MIHNLPNFSTCDLNALNKQQLRSLVKGIRPIFKRSIDMRRADATAYRQYLQDYELWRLSVEASKPATVLQFKPRNEIANKYLTSWERKQPKASSRHLYLIR